MKNIVIISYTLLIAVNILFGTVLCIYPTFNMWLLTGALAMSGLLTYIALASRQMPKAFKIGLSGTYSLLLLVQVFLSFACDATLQGNILFMIYILSFVAQIIIGLTISKFSKR